MYLTQTLCMAAYQRGPMTVIAALHSMRDVYWRCKVRVLKSKHQ
jgi:hypothetical protein